ncbi:protein with a bacterial immunoglobulin-like domain protein [Legionella santicrucis]|uniref:Protein with a bacterial immunoglobulin-like domain protein n=1 Tax=Legionella santicrucis TaxID=45074 RepID=A0A0W0YA31_9GAMM|nr:Ig-like domain-containing protein [Legionella santicrucis]KTD53680.1 protein with a bacterial immunoglobulin-like domain protein [Legionella santicrucis]
MTCRFASLMTRIGLGFLGLCIPILGAALSKPTFSIVATTPTQVIVPSTGAVKVHYQVTNNTKLTRTLTMVPIKGISQNTSGLENCKSPFTLAPNQSCLLSLQLNGNELPASYLGGPMVCKTNGPKDPSPSPFLCSRPSAESILSIKVAPLLAIKVYHGRPLLNSSVAHGLSRKFYAIGFFANEIHRNLTQNVVWHSSDSSIATVSNSLGSYGFVTGVNVGDTTISASLNGLSGSAPIHVTDAVVTQIQITPSEPSIAKGTNQQFTATGILSNETTLDLTTQVSWTSTNSAVAAISNASGSQGLATGNAVGTTSIAASYGLQTTSTSLKVTAATLSLIQVTPVNPSIHKGTAQQFMATGVYSDNSTEDLTSFVTWNSSDPLVASIENAPDTPGLALGVGTGESRITATYGSVSGNASLTVTPAQLTSIVISPYNLSIPNGYSQQYTAKGIYTDNTTQDLTTEVAWASSDTNVATISNAPDSPGAAVGKSVGSTRITASLSGVTGVAPLNIIEAVLDSIVVTPANTSLPLGTNQQYKAIGIFSDASEENLTTDVTWTSSDTSVVTISNATDTQGLVQSVSLGNATLKASLNGLSGTTGITVSAAILTGITVTPADSSIPRGINSTQQMTATGAYTDSTTKDITTEVYWQSDNGNIATVSNAVGTEGLVTAQEVAATTNIIATQNLISGSTSLTVFAPQIGQSYGGGIIACSWGGLLSLIAAPTDISSGIMWGGTGTAIGLGAQSTIDGASNTQAIVNTLGLSNSYAAGLCATYNGGGYTDWFLPSSEQLHCLWSYYANIGGFYPGGDYWSSTESSENSTYNAITENFLYGVQSNVDKSAPLRVRCVRQFM